MSTKTGRQKPHRLTRSARVRVFADALTAESGERASTAAARAVAPAGATAEPDGKARDAAAKELGAQAAAIEDAIDDLSQRLKHASTIPEKNAILDQQDRLHSVLRDIMAKQILNVLMSKAVQDALKELGKITENLTNEAKLLKQATNVVNATSKVLGFVSDALNLLTRVGLLAA